MSNAILGINRRGKHKQVFLMTKIAVNQPKR